MSVWEIALRKQLRHGASRFELDVHFASDAQRVVLHGPSGAGKTQTLRMISGIVTPDAGRLTVLIGLWTRKNPCFHVCLKSVHQRNIIYCII